MEKLIAAAKENDGDANVNAKDSKWLTPLHRACRQSNEVSFTLDEGMHQPSPKVLKYPEISLNAPHGSVDINA